SSDGENLTYIPFKETKKYVDKVSTRYNVYKFLYE
ncbi:MAG: lytic transglycosylase domain-containing protein, partial [Clostridium saudiense]|nr:lytic transglycosylase domain-containing protein [Clostridium saudiense]